MMETIRKSVMTITSRHPISIPFETSGQKSKACWNNHRALWMISISLIDMLLVVPKQRRIHQANPVWHLYWYFTSVIAVFIASIEDDATG